MPKKRLSKNLKQLRDIALSITNERKISVVYNEEIPTACINLKTLLIQLSPNLIPKQIQKYPRIFQRCLDAEVSHESGHYVVTRPIDSRYRRFEESKKYKKLARLLINILEDKRVNYFIENRYRYDLGKRLKWFRELMRKSGKTAIDNIIKTSNIAQASKPAIMVNQIIHVGLYDGKINHKLFAQLNRTQRKDVKRALKLLDNAQYIYIKYRLIKIAEELYELIEKHITPQDINKITIYVPVSIEDGQLGLDLSEEDESEVAREEASEEQAEREKEDLSRGGGAGISRGEHIPSPQPNFNRYFEFVARNQPRIDELLSKLKVFVKPIVKRAIFKKHGRIMNPILSKAYVSSMRKTMNRIYQKSEVFFEKQKVALGFIIDFSGSMSYSVACDVVTIMNEVFGNWLDDESYSIIVFGGDYQKIKTFFEQFNTTRARIGGISVDSSATMIANPLEDMRKMFNSITEEKQKILVICSDFWFGDDDDAEEVIKSIVKEGVQILFIGLCSGDQKINQVCPNERNIYRTYIGDLNNLPEFFVSIYMKSIQNIRR